MGAMGRTGARGPRGLKGPIGERGPKGSRGDQGTAAFLCCPIILVVSSFLYFTLAARLEL